MKGDILSLKTLLEDFYDLDTGKPLASNDSGFLRGEAKEYMIASKDFEEIEGDGYSVDA